MADDQRFNLREESCGSEAGVSSSLVLVFLFGFGMPFFVVKDMFWDVFLLTI